jgi:hypothetical protein
MAKLSDVADDDVFAIPGVDDLFAAHPADFVRLRDELAKRLKTDGGKSAAAAVKKLRKPSAVAGAVNRVARSDPQGIADLLDAAVEVRAAQAQAVKGGDAAGLRTASRRWRELVQATAAKAAAVAGAQYRDEAAATIEAASADEELRGLLVAGRLMAALSPSGFGLAGMPDPPERLHDGVVPAEHEQLRQEAPPPPEPQEDLQEQKRLRERAAAREKAVHRLRRAEQRLEVAQRAVEEAEAALRALEDS